MTGAQFKRILCGKGRSFALPIDAIKERLGTPRQIHLLSKWCPKTGRDVIVMNYPTDDGQVDVFGVAGFLNGEQAMLDGYVVFSEHAEHDQVEKRIAFATGQMSLFG